MSVLQGVCTSINICIEISKNMHLAKACHQLVFTCYSSFALDVSLTVYDRVQ